MTFQAFSYSNSLVPGQVNSALLSGSSEQSSRLEDKQSRRAPITFASPRDPRTVPSNHFREFWGSLRGILAFCEDLAQTAHLCMCGRLLVGNVVQVVYTVVLFRLKLRAYNLFVFGYSRPKRVKRYFFCQVSVTFRCCQQILQQVSGLEHILSKQAMKQLQFL